MNSCIFFSRIGVAKPNDLFASFDKTLNDHKYKINDGLSVRDFMTTWTEQPGYPVLYVKKDKTSNTFILTQVNTKSMLSATVHYIYIYICTMHT